MNRNLLLLLCTSPIAIVCSVAQAAETGGVRGEVLDEQGLAIPGAVVVITGVDVAGERVVTTDENGQFRMLSLSPGPKDVMVKKEGFAPIRYTVTIRLDETAFVPVTLRQAGMAGEEIVVTEVLPVVDTTRTAISTQITTDMLENLPIGRSYQSATNLVAGVSGRVDTQDGGPGKGNPSVRGEGQYGNNALIDGISNRDPSTKTYGTNVNFDAIQEIQVYTDGYPAEFSNATGMLVNVVTKDGGNEHFGSIGYYPEFSASGGKYDVYNPETGLTEPTDKRKYFYNEAALTVGGPIKKDKLWYFAAFTFNHDKTLFEGHLDDPPNIDQGYQGLAKVTWFITPDLSMQYQVAPSASGTDNYETSGQFATDGQAQRKDHSLSQIVTTRWRPSEKTEFEFKATAWSLGLDVIPQSDDASAPRIKADTGYSYNNYDSYDYNTRYRSGATLKVTHLVDDVLGDHRFKGGVEFFQLSSTRELIFTGSSQALHDQLGGDAQTADGAYDYSEDPRLSHEDDWGYGYGYEFGSSEEYPCTAAANYTDCATYEQHVNVGPLGNTSEQFGFFIQDDWSLKPLTFNLGLRLDREQLYQNAGQKIVDSYMPAPRLGIAWDATRDSKTLVSLNAGRYYDNAGNTFVQWSNTRSANIYRQYQNNGAGGYDLVWEQNPSANPLIFCTEESIDQLKGLGFLDDETGTQIWEDYCNSEELKPYHMDKIVLGVKREIVPLLAVGLKGIMSHTSDLPEDVNYDLFTFVVTNPPEKVRDYRAVELSVERKYDGKWQMLGSYTLSESMGTMPGQFEISSGGGSGSNGNEVGIYLDDIGDPSARTEFINMRDFWRDYYVAGLAGLGREGDESFYGYLPYHSFHSVKLAGSYTLPFGTTIGGVYEFDSGHAWQKRGYADAYQDYFAFPEGRGTRFMPAVHYIQLGLSQSFKLGENRELAATVDVFNVPDFETPVSYFENYDENTGGAGFGEPLYRQSPRAVRVGVSYSY